MKSRALVTTHYSVPPRRSSRVRFSSGRRQGLKRHSASRMISTALPPAPRRQLGSADGARAEVQQVIAGPTAGCVRRRWRCSNGPRLRRATAATASPIASWRIHAAARSIVPRSRARPRRIGVSDARPGGGGAYDLCRHRRSPQRERIFPGPAPAGGLQGAASAPGFFPIAASSGADLVHHRCDSEFAEELRPGQGCSRSRVGWAPRGSIRPIRISPPSSPAAESCCSGAARREQS